MKANYWPCLSVYVFFIATTAKRREEAGRRGLREVVPGRELETCTEERAERLRGERFSLYLRANGFSCESFPFGLRRFRLDDSMVTGLVVEQP